MTRVFLDACVLFPPLVRRLLLDTAAAGRFVPLWSDRVLEEWRISAGAKQGPDAWVRIAAARAAMAEVFPDASARADPEVEAGLVLPDPADAHVLAAAAAGQANILVTFNLRDFPNRTMARFGIALRHPDGFLWEMFSQAPETLAPLIERALADMGIAPDRGRTALKRARLPRLGKAWDAARS